jgi:hypothetical protein
VLGEWNELGARVAFEKRGSTSRPGVVGEVHPGMS